jgi:hypothetical protein
VSRLATLQVTWWSALVAEQLPGGEADRVGFLIRDAVPADVAVLRDVFADRRSPTTATGTTCWRIQMLWSSP